MRLFFLFFLFFVQLSADESKCLVDSNILFSILKTENHKNVAIDYPFIISFNRKADRKILKGTFLKKYFLDGRTIDCEDKKKCVAITSVLVEKGYTNIDLGAFQINYKFHKMPLGDYFSLKESYYKACSLVESNIKRFGYNWYAIAGYHSFTMSENLKYQKYLIANYKKR